MNKVDLAAWMNKNAKLNDLYELKIGDQIKDYRGEIHTVEKIDLWEDEPLSVENHGAIYCNDNVSFAFYGWTSEFRIVKSED